MKILKRLIWLSIDFVVAMAIVISLFPSTTQHAVLEEVDGFDLESTDAVSFPYAQTFKISAYYSPLPCQAKYATGSYAGDIRLNGSGVNSADGTPVYPGMIAAPKTYLFGTKMYIPSIGVVAVHDRGGAIVPAGQRGQDFDRLDVWMGYGDKGLARALNWGKRVVDTTVYGINDAIEEQITLMDYNPGEAVPNQCDGPIDVPYFTSEVEETHAEEVIEAWFTYNLNPGSEGYRVQELQEELRRLNYYKGQINGVYDEVTEHAVYKFQQSQLIVLDNSIQGAGVFGPKTRERLNEIVSSRNYTNVLVAQATANYLDKMTLIAEVEVESDSGDVVEVVVEEKVAPEIANVSAEADTKVAYLSSHMDFGLVSPEVRLVQEFLRDEGYFHSPLITNYYGLATQEAVYNFQVENGIVSSREDTGAGRIGPSTLKVINQMAA